MGVTRVALMELQEMATASSLQVHDERSGKA
jgi:hypothetical protein